MNICVLLVNNARSNVVQMDPMLSRTVLAAEDLGVLDEAITFAAIMSGGGNIFWRGGSASDKATADVKKVCMHHAPPRCCIFHSPSQRFDPYRSTGSLLHPVHGRLSSRGHGLPEVACATAAGASKVVHRELRLWKGHARCRTCRRRAPHAATRRRPQGEGILRRIDTSEDAWDRSRAMYTSLSLFRVFESGLITHSLLKWA
jgi:hypothetical protein